MSKALALRQAIIRASLVLSALVSLGLGFAPPSYGQTFSGRLFSELVFVPVPPVFAGAQSRAVLTISVADAAFSSDTKLNLSGLVFQRFSLRIGISPLLVNDRIVFIDGFLFDRNELTITLNMADLHVATELILDDLVIPPTPPALPPNIQPGLVLELSGKTFDGLLTISSTTGFAVTATVEDLNLDDDREPDRIVSMPFIFREEVLGVDLAFTKSFTLSTDTLFTLTGWTKEIIGFALRLGDPDFSFSANLVTTLLLPGVVIGRIVFDADMLIRPITWKSLTFFNDPDGPGPSPLALREQIFTLIYSFGTLDLLSEVCLGPGCPFAALFPPAMAEWRIGFEWRFGS